MPQPRAFSTSNDEVFIGRDLGHTKNYSEDVAAKIDAEIKRIIDECYARCEEILKANRAKVEETVSILLEKEKVDAEEFYALFVEKPTSVRIGKPAAPQAQPEATIRNVVKHRSVEPSEVEPDEVEPTEAGSLPLTTPGNPQST